MTDDWWDPSHDLPAFRTKRQSYGDADGGDYVRGSEDPRVPATAVRYPTTTVDLTTLTAVDKGLLHVKPWVSYFVPATSQEETAHTDAYHTLFVEWNWPEVIEDIWEEYALVRSSYGHPNCPEQGITVDRGTPTDEKLERFDNGTLKPRVILDKDLPSGRWYYYSLFFRTTPVDWQVYESDSCLLPQNYGHSNRMWDAVPPYYQFIDDNIRAYDGYLSRFLRTIGFMQDNIRGFVEGLLELHWVDRSPMPLLKHLGDNYGMPYEQGLGDIRYRALLANLTHLQEMRGTAIGIEDMIETVSQYETDAIPSTQSGNHLLLPADADPVASPGHWAPIHPDTDMTGKGGPGPATYLTYDKVTLVPDPTPSPPISGARGSLEITTLDTDATGELFITCGDGMRKDGTVTSEFIPLYAGMPCRPGQPFGFSIYIQSQAAGVTVTPFFLFFRAGGAPTDLISAHPGATNPVAGDGTWLEFTHTFVAPADSYYIVPALLFESRSGDDGDGTSLIIRLGAAMVYSTETGAPVATAARDNLLSVGDPSDQIGTPPKPGDPTFKGSVLGQPRTEF